MIKDVAVKKLKVIKDSRGFLMEIFRNDDNFFQKFGQVYMTVVKKGAAKGWHYHKKQDDHFVCILGKALVVLCDFRKNSPTYKKVQKFILTEPKVKGNHLLVKIPRGVLHGFTAYKCSEARIVNIPTEKYNYKKPDEFRFPWNSKKVPYQWPKGVKIGG
ncbi:dTDP-4-dehydrorhamnose 3,5-epimerase family protein [Patescibacteria group bacterium]|nr:dTDP-4-dehydrorhamnose 3,5-epimerase family protein [Patescibacteria group bacterium]